MMDAIQDLVDTDGLPRDWAKDTEGWVTAAFARLASYGLHGDKARAGLRPRVYPIFQGGWLRLEL